MDANSFLFSDFPISSFVFFNFFFPALKRRAIVVCPFGTSKDMNSDMHDSAGHLTALGWTGFALYLIAALLSFRAAASNRSQSSAVSSQQFYETGRVWMWVGIILAALGLNKPLDMQTRLINLGRQIAGRENLSAHWTGLHVLFFMGFILLVVALIAVVLSRFTAEIRQFARQLPLAAAGIILICIYILIRAASINRVDQMLGFKLDHVPHIWLLEAGGLLLIIVQALRKPDKFKN